MPTITEPRVRNEIEAKLAANEAAMRDSDVDWNDPDPWNHRAMPWSLGREQGDMLYALARAMNARRIVEFATSVGLSTLHLAAAIRDNGGGTVIGAELVPEKIEQARTSLDAAGLAEFVEIREGDATRTLRDVGGPVDIVLIDGWPDGQHPSLDRRVLDLLVPQLRVGGIVFDDNGDNDVRGFLTDPANGFYSADLPFQDRMSALGILAVKL
ncbi:MAG TPA: class I SAM-dependent methyltransferase [Solirubrobacteraceae bacterium]